MRRKCDNIGCYFSERPNGLVMCQECMVEYVGSLNDDDLYEMFVEAVEEFKCNKHFRFQVRAIDGDLTGDYEEDCAIFEDRMFKVINSILLER